VVQPLCLVQKSRMFSAAFEPLLAVALVATVQVGPATSRRQASSDQEFELCLLGFFALIECPSIDWDMNHRLQVQCEVKNAGKMLFLPDVRVFVFCKVAHNRNVMCCQ
jgi:hypothetical protein